MRVVDNQRYPAFFYWRGRRHVMQVQLEQPQPHPVQLI
jgi:hypothetical protein